MKNWLIIVIVLFLLSFFFIFDNKKDNYVEDSNIETRAIYFSYIEFSKYIMDKSNIEQKNNIINVLDNVKELNFNRIIVHVRPFSDSIYESEYYPVSKYVLNDKGEYPNYDVLQFIISESHKRGIKVDAWINPYRISNVSSTVPKMLSNYSYKKTDKGIYLNPASGDVNDLIINGILEIVNKYDVDGIHFDDYFYPDSKIDLDDYNVYKANGGGLSLKEYRYENINNLIRSVYSAIKKANKNVLFGIAPEGNIDNCYNNSYLDVKTILSTSGYVDYIMPQIYYGFYNKTRPFIDTIDTWNDLIKEKSIKLIPALAIYKSGNYDKYALSGGNEWIDNSDIIKREIIYSRGLSKYNGFSLFSYNYLFNDEYKNANNVKELDNLKKIL